MNTQKNAAKDVILRIAPVMSERFSLEIIPAENGLDVFEFEAMDNHLILRGNTGVSICSGFNRYLQDYCRCELSWCGDQLNIPDILPVTNGTIRVVCPGKFRVYFNYCTFSYSAAWWDWERWEREIDFMAMKGINMPLSVVGLEGVYFNVLQKFGYTPDEARQFLAGPAFLAWQWMTNIQSHAGPLPLSWIESHIRLGQKIIQRQRELGMMPIQQAFSGFVPRDFDRKNPSAKLLMKEDWAGFPGTAELEPLTPEFNAFGEAFLKEEIRLFGKGQYYAADPFHESSPPREDEEYLRTVGENIFQAMTQVVPDAIWVMQSWSVRKAIATAVPVGKLLMLDLGGSYSERENFWGHDFVIGILHNFGGRINLHGDLEKLAENALHQAGAANAAGVGFFMEGITQNPVFYALAFDLIWLDRSVNIHDWLKAYARRRYGQQDDAAERAWQLLLQNPYRRGTSGVENSSIIAARPALDSCKSGPNAGLSIPYDPEKLLEAWQLLLSSADRLKNSSGYLYDIVDIGRQALSNLAQEIHWEVRLSAHDGDVEKFRMMTLHFQEALLLTDELVSTRRELNFYEWVRAARSWATSEDEKALYELNASLLPTIWGPLEVEPRIFDYAWREWGGLIKDYYLERWRRFHNYLEQYLLKYDDSFCTKVYGRQAWRANEFLSNLADWEIAWVKSPRTVNEFKPSCELTAARKAYDWLRPLAETMYGNEHKIRVENLKNELTGNQFGALLKKVDTVEWQLGENHSLEIELPSNLYGEGKNTFHLIPALEIPNWHTPRMILLQNEQPVADSIHSDKVEFSRTGWSWTSQQDGIVFNAKYILKLEIRTPEFIGNVQNFEIRLERN